MFDGPFPSNPANKPLRVTNLSEHLFSSHYTPPPPLLLSANLLCSDCSLSPCLLPLSSFSRTQTLFQSMVLVKGTKSICLTRLHRQSRLFSSSMLALFPPPSSVCFHDSLVFLRLRSVSFFPLKIFLIVYVVWLPSLTLLPHELSRTWSCCRWSCGSLLPKSPEKECVCFLCRHACLLCVFLAQI